MTIHTATAPRSASFAQTAARFGAALLGRVADGIDRSVDVRIETWAAALSISLLLGAISFQYLGGLLPCELCLKQRWFHGLAIGVAMMAMSTRMKSRNRAFSLFALSGALAGCSAIAGFHVGVEQHWWGASCSMNIARGNVEQIMAALEHQPVIKCDEVAWSFLGLSMATWNMLFSTGASWLVFSRSMTTYRAARLTRRIFHIPLGARPTAMSQRGYRPQNMQIVQREMQQPARR